MDDFSDSDVEVDELDEVFTKAADHVQHIHSAQMPEDLLELYALYKQATVGRCTTPKPGIFSIKERSKWNAWNDLGKMSKTDSQRLYVEKVQKLDPNWYESAKGKMKVKSSWVVHSVPENPPEDQKAEHEKDSFDHVKEGNLERLKETFTTTQLEQLDEHGLGLIHWATDRNSTDILEFLLVSGANVNFRDNEQQTALHYATSCNHLECLQILLKYKADPLAINADGHTCMDVADSEARAMLQNFHA